MKLVPARAAVFSRDDLSFIMLRCSIHRWGDPARPLLCRHHCPMKLRLTWRFTWLRRSGSDARCDRHARIRQATRRSCGLHDLHWVGWHDEIVAPGPYVRWHLVLRSSKYVDADRRRHSHPHGTRKRCGIGALPTVRGSRRFRSPSTPLAVPRRGGGRNEKKLPA